MEQKRGGDKVLDCHRRYLRDSEAHHDHESKVLVVLGTAPQGDLWILRIPTLGAGWVGEWVLHDGI